MCLCVCTVAAGASAPRPFLHRRACAIFDLLHIGFRLIVLLAYAGCCCGAAEACYFLWLLSAFRSYAAVDSLNAFSKACHHVYVRPELSNNTYSYKSPQPIFTSPVASILPWNTLPPPRIFLLTKSFNIPPRHLPLRPSNFNRQRSWSAL